MQQFVNGRLFVVVILQLCLNALETMQASTGPAIERNRRNLFCLQSKGASALEAADYTQGRVCCEVAKVW